MKATWWDKTFVLMLFWALVAGCSGSGGETAGTAPALERAPDVAEAQPATVEGECRQGAQQITAQFQDFIAELGDLSPEEFLAQDEIEGLSGFQDGIANTISTVANQSSTLCDLDGLQGFVDEELAAIENQSLLSTYLVSSIRFGGVRERNDVLLRPDDDFAAVASLLDDGSSITLEAGTYEFDTSILVQQDLIIVGAGRETTTIRSTASDTAVAVFGDGKLTLRDLAVEHAGDASASVILAFGAEIDLENVHVRGAIGDEETGGGSGILLSDGVVSDEGELVPAPSGASSTDVAQSRIVNSWVTDNAIAGITVAGLLTPVIDGNTISDNGACGLCLVGQAGGYIQENTLSGNDFGIQASDVSRPELVSNQLVGNISVGMVFLGDTTAQVAQNEVRDNGEVGIAIQDNAAPTLQSNTISQQTIGLTIVGAATPTVSDSTITGAEVAVQVAGTAAPMLSGTTLIDTVSVGLVHREQSSGTFVGTTMTGEQAVGILVEGEAKPAIRDVSVERAEVSVSYREQAGGTLMNSTFTDPQIAVQIEDQAAPVIETNTVIRPTAAGVVIRSDGDVVIRSNTFIDSAALAVGAAGDANSLIELNTFAGGETALSIIENAAGIVRDNTLSGQTVAMQIGDAASPLIEGNEIFDAVAAALVVRDSSTPQVLRNTIVNPLAVGIQVVDSAIPEVTENTFLAGLEVPESDAANDGEIDDRETTSEGGETGVDSVADEGPESDDEATPETNESEGAPDAEIDGQADAANDPETSSSTVAILFADETSGIAADNEVFGFVIGVQVGDAATPDLDGNFVDGGALNGVGFLFRETASGAVTNNRTTAHSIGFQISDAASPVLTDNTVEQAADVAFLVQGTATPQLDGNACPTAAPGIGVLEQAAPIVGTNRCLALDG